MTTNGLQFTVTGLSSNTQYGYSVVIKDENDALIASYSGEFTTTGEDEPTGFGNTTMKQRPPKSSATAKSSSSAAKRYIQSKDRK